MPGNWMRWLSAFEEIVTREELDDTRREQGDIGGEVLAVDLHIGHGEVDQGEFKLTAGPGWQQTLRASGDLEGESIAPGSPTPIGPT
jgi:hypothetical protein